MGRLSLWVPLQPEDVNERYLNVDVGVLSFTLKGIIIVNVNSPRFADTDPILEISLINNLPILYDGVVLNILSYEILAVRQEFKFITRVNIAPIVQSLSTHLVVLEFNGAHCIVLIITVSVREKAMHFEGRGNGYIPDLESELFNVNEAHLPLLEPFLLGKVDHFELVGTCNEYLVFEKSGMHETFIA
jgi:hypothetical protein